MEGGNVNDLPQLRPYNREFTDILSRNAEKRRGEGRTSDATPPTSHLLRVSSHDVVVGVYASEKGLFSPGLGAKRREEEDDEETRSSFEGAISPFLSFHLLLLLFARLRTESCRF